MQNTLSLIAVFTHPTGATNLALLGRNAMDMGVSWAHRLWISAKQAWHITNNLCIYCKDVNHYASNYTKANRKTLLRGIVINNEKAITIKPAVFLKKISPADLKNL